MFLFLHLNISYILHSFLLLDLSSPKYSFCLISSRENTFVYLIVYNNQDLRVFGFLQQPLSCFQLMLHLFRDQDQIVIFSFLDLIHHLFIQNLFDFNLFFNFMNQINLFLVAISQLVYWRLTYYLIDHYPIFYLILSQVIHLQ